MNTNERFIKGLQSNFDFTGLGRWLLLAGAVGIVAGLGAVLFQFLLQTATNFCFEEIIGLPVRGPINEHSSWPFFGVSRFSPLWLIVLPGIGGLLTGILVFNFAPEAKGHGTDAAIDAYHRKLGVIRARVPMVKLISSVITLSTGGSGGREGPIAQIGAGFGSFLATKLKLDPKTRRLMVAAGLGAGVGAIFRAPLASALFAAEVLYSGIEMESEVILPAALASIVSYSVFGSVYGFEPIFGVASAMSFSGPTELLPYLVLALVEGAGALVYVNLFHFVTRFFDRLSMPNLLKPAIGGLLTGLLGFSLLFASGDRQVLSVLSTGYGVLQQILTTDGAEVGILTLLLIAGGKILTTSFTIGSGGSAGVFGPSMVIGGSLGAAVGLVFHLLWPSWVVHPAAYMIVGMAGFFSAAASAPLSTLVMVSELTGNYELLIPCMWVSAISFLVGRRWTLYQSQVPSRVNSPAHLGDYAREILDIAPVSKVYKKARKFAVVAADFPLTALADAAASTSQRIFPVQDAAGRVRGAFRLNDLNIALQQPAQERQKLRALDLLGPESPMVDLGASVYHALTRMNSQQADELLVMDGRVSSSEALVGIITRADILLYYSRQLSKLKLQEEVSLPGYAN